MMKKYGAPLLVIILGSLLLYLENNYVFLPIKDDLVKITTVFVLFVLGAYMSQRVGRKGWVKKLFVVCFTLALLLIQMDILYVEVIALFLNEIKATSFIFNLLYLYLGYIFF